MSLVQMAFSERSSKLLSVSHTRYWIIQNRFSRVSQSCALPRALIHEMQFICLPNIKFLMSLIDLFIHSFTFFLAFSLTDVNWPLH